MEMNTKYFGRLPFSEKEAILFQEGLFGFEELKKYLLIPFGDENNSLFCLQSLEDENIAFIVMNPFAFMPEYDPLPLLKDLQAVEATKESLIEYYNICVLHEDIKNSTVNLRCPLLINPETRKAKQLILENTEYPFKFPFSEFQKKED